MIVVEEYGENFKRTYSDADFYIRKIGTDEVYSEAIDIKSSIFEYEETEIRIETTYTAEQLEQMTSSELKSICSEMGISGTMTKANMIALILDKQNNT